MAKRIVITGASTYAVKNMGDDAMLATLVQGLRRKYPEADLVFLARHPDDNYDRTFGFRSLKNMDHDTRDASRGRFFLGFNDGDVGANLRAIKEVIDGADLLVLGGNSFMEVSPNRFLHGVSSYVATLGQLAQFCGTPFSLFGLNVVEPLQDETTTAHAKFLCGNAQHVTLREDSALNNLEKSHVAVPRYSILGDPAFGVENTIGTEDAKAVLARENISLPNKPIIGVNLRHQYWTDSEAELHRRARLYAEMLNQFKNEVDCHFLFIPNCTYQAANKWQDDRIVHPLVTEAMTSKNCVSAVTQDLEVFETLALFGLLDMHISNRRHSSIFAALHHKPFLSFEAEFSGHMAPFLGDLGVPDQLAGFNENNGEIFAKLQNTWRQRQTISQILAANIPNLQSKARHHVEALTKGL